MLTFLLLKILTRLNSTQKLNLHVKTGNHYLKPIFRKPF